MDNFKNYYQVLGLSPDASKEDIKHAYRIYALKFHPDKQNSDKFFEERFKEIKEAYDILFDDSKRKDYDFRYKKAMGYSAGSKSVPNYDTYSYSSTTKEPKTNNEKVHRNRVYYTSSIISINGLYIDCKNKRYILTDYESAVIRKDEGISMLFISILLILLGLITLVFVIGILFIALGIYGLFYKEYILFLRGNKDDVWLLNGKKPKMEKLCNFINQAIYERSKEENIG